MLRERSCEPVPQVLVQVDQVVQAVTTQFTGQVSVLQLCSSASDPQTYPPNCAWVVTLRERLWEPVPQVSEQVDQAVHAVTSQ